MDMTAVLRTNGEDIAGKGRYDRLEAMVNGQAAVLEMISNGTPLSSILEGIVHWVESQSSGGVYVSILFLDREGKHLLHGAAPGLPDEYNRAIHGVAIGPEVGSCGTAAFTKEQVIVEDIASSPLWTDYRDLALKYGLRACWSTPLLNKNGKVIGTFAIYYDQPKSPTEEELQLIHLVGRTTEIAIEFKQAEEDRELLHQRDLKLNEKIRKEREEFHKLLMIAPAVIAVLKGPKHVFDLANPNYMQAVGINRDILGKPISEALPEVVEQGFTDILDTVYRTGQPFFGNEIGIKLDRGGNGILEDRYFNFVYQPIKSDTHETEGIYVHATDITDLTMARMRAEESEERFRSFVLNSPSPIAIYIGREMRVQTANEAVLEAWGKDSSVIGKTFREALPELEGDRFYDLLDDVYTTGITHTEREGRVELERNGKREVTYFNFTYKALKDEQGRIYGVINTGSEVTDLVLARQQLIVAEEALRNAIDIAELGTWSIDLTNEMVICSSRVCNWFGLKERITERQKILAAIHDDDRERVRITIENAIATNGNYQSEYRVVDRTTGTVRVLHAKGKVMLNEGGEPYRLSGTVRDVTLEKMSELELEQQVEARTGELRKANIDLANVNQNLKQFAYVASHDLQEPLRKINMFSDILQQNHRSGLDNPGRMYLEKITQSAHRMTTLIKDLLNFSRVDAGEKAWVPVNLNTILNNIRIDFEVLIHQKDAQLVIDELGTIEANPVQMNQLFYNLVGNALKYARENVPPVITITSRRMDRDEVNKYSGLNSAWNYTEIVVRDNGIGFDQHFAEQIFTIFQRLHGRSEYEGTGIGLALCKKIATNHEGTIFALSREGNGASFHVMLPVKRQITD